MHLGRAHGVPMRLAEATHMANEEQADFLAKLIERALGTIRGKTIALGAGLQAGDGRCSGVPGGEARRVLLDGGASVVGHDPEAARSFEKALASRVKVVDRDYDALNGAHALVLLTEWRSYRAPNFQEIPRPAADGEDGSPAVVVDGRNIWRPADVLRAGLRYQGIGVPPRGVVSRGRGHRGPRDNELRAFHREPDTHLPPLAAR